MVSRLQFSSLWQQKPSQETSTHSPNSLAGEGGGGSSSPSRLVTPASHKTIGKQNFGDNYKASSLQAWLTWVQGGQECHQTPGEQGDTRRMGFEEIPVASPPQPSWDWILLDTGLEHWTDPTCSIPGLLLHAHNAPKIPNLFVRERPEQGVGVEEETGRKDERANKSYQLKSKQATEMITLKLFTPG